MACAGRDKSACLRRGVVEGAGHVRTTESRKAEDVPAPDAVEENGAAVGFMDGKPRGLTVGVSGERAKRSEVRCTPGLGNGMGGEARMLARPGRRADAGVSKSGGDARCGGRAGS